MTGEQRVVDVETLAVEEARRGLDVQRAALDEVRSRTSIVLAASAVVVSFLGGQAIQESGWSIGVGLALLSFMGTLALGGGILWPSRRAWLFRADAKVLLEDFAGDDALPSVSARRHLALSLQAAAENNRERLERLYRQFQLALICLGAQTLIWITVLSNA